MERHSDGPPPYAHLYLTPVEVESSRDSPPPYSMFALASSQIPVNNSSNTEHTHPHTVPSPVRIRDPGSNRRLWNNNLVAATLVMIISIVLLNPCACICAVVGVMYNISYRPKVCRSIASDFFHRVWCGPSIVLHCMWLYNWNTVEILILRPLGQPNWRPFLCRMQEVHRFLFMTLSY